MDPIPALLDPTPALLDPCLPEVVMVVVVRIVEAFPKDIPPDTILDLVWL